VSRFNARFCRSTVSISSGFFLWRQNQLEKVCLQWREIGSWSTAKAPPLCALVAAGLQSVAQRLPSLDRLGDKFLTGEGA
jgi:hypothetical protein